MMKIKVSFENLSKEQQEQLLNLVELGNKKTLGIKYPNFGDRYWFINSNGVTHVSEWSNADSDKFRFETGNYFKTEKEVKHAMEKQIVLGKLKLFAEQNNECELN